MNAESPRIAVVIPAFNASTFVEETIQSVLGQTQPADEIVVVDDGSGDNTAEVAARINARVTVLRQKNGGPGSARQRGLEATTAELLLFLDADDILHPTALEKLSAALLHDPSASLAYGQAELWSPAGVFETHIDKLAPRRSGDPWTGLLYGNFMRTPGCAVIRRDALNAAGGWDPDLTLKGNEDWDLWLRLAETRPFAFLAEPLLKYRIEGKGVSSGRRKMYESMFKVFDKQRLRWKGVRGRRQVIDAGEWDACKRVTKVLLHDVRSACLKGNLFGAAALTLENVRTCTRPVIHHAFSFTPHRQS